MKTVKGYLDLGLVFVGDDELLSETSNKDSKGISMSRCWLAHNRYDGFLEVADGFFSNKGWAPSSFAWRNNDGVKPEYKGLIHAMFENGSIIQDVADSLSWGGSFNPIIKWRPVVFQSYDVHENKDSSFILPVGIDSPELRGAFKSLKEHLENKPPFWNKSIKTINCPCVAVNIKAVKPILSPKEDKPMRPVYTEEMHAKGELPPVDSEVALRYKFDSKQIHIIGKVLYASIEHCIIDGEHKECHYKMCDYTYEPIIKTIKVNGFDVPAPMSESPECGSEYFVIDMLDEGLFCSVEWEGDDKDNQWLSQGIIHSTNSAAIAHAKAMLGIDPNA